MTDAEQFRAFRFALDPTAVQRQDLARHVGAARWAFNHALARKVAAHREWRTRVAALMEAGVPEADARRQVKVPIPSKPQIQLALNRARGDDRTAQDGLCPWWHEVSTYAFQSRPGHPAGVIQRRSQTPPWQQVKKHAAHAGHRTARSIEGQ